MENNMMEIVEVLDHLKDEVYRLQQEQEEKDKATKEYRDTNPFVCPHIVSIMQNLLGPLDLLNSRLVCGEWNEVYERKRLIDTKGQYVTLISQEDVRRFNEAFGGSLAVPYSHFEIAAHLLTDEFILLNANNNPLRTFIDHFSDSIEEMKILLARTFPDFTLFFSTNNFHHLKTIKISNWNKYDKPLTQEDLDVVFEEGLPIHMFGMPNLLFVEPNKYHNYPTLPSLTSFVIEDGLIVNPLNVFPFLEKMAPNLTSISFPSSIGLIYSAIETLHRKFFSAYTMCPQINFNVLNFQDMTDLSAKYLENWSLYKNLKLRQFRCSRLRFLESSFALDSFSIFLLRQSSWLKCLEIGCQWGWPEEVETESEDENHSDEEEEEDESDAEDEEEAESGSEDEEEIGEDENQATGEIKYNFFEKSFYPFPLVERLSLKSSSVLLTKEYYLRNIQWPCLHELDFSFSSIPQEKLKDFIGASEVFPKLVKLTVSYYEDMPVVGYLKTLQLKFPNITSFEYHLKAGKHDKFTSLPELWTKWTATLQHLTIHLTPDSGIFSWPCEELLTGIYGDARMCVTGKNRFILLNRMPSICLNTELVSFTLLGKSFMRDDVANLSFLGMEKLKKLCYSGRRRSPYQFSAVVVAALGRRGIEIKAIDGD